jgi:Cu+-exporting ATPase
MAVVEGDRSFCCLGCQAVFTLLTEGGLGQFYELAPAPGARVEPGATQRPWDFLDDPSVEEKLLDFANERQAKVTLHVPAIHCVACVWLLENLFRLRADIGESRVNFARREVSITYDREQVKLSDLAALLASLGYEPALTLSELDPGTSRPTPRWRQRQWLQLGVAGFGFGNVMLMALPGYLGLDSVSGPWFRSLAGWLSLALALPVLVYSAADFWRAAWFSLQQRVLTLEVPIALGLAAIYGQSLFEVASGRGEGYSDSLTGLIFFLLCGRLFQRKTFDRLAFNRDYKGFFPLATLRKTPTGEESVAISQLGVGDRLVIRHGELVPADARLVDGHALVDYSFVTGESLPVTRRAGEVLFAGGRQMSGAIEVETVKPVSESYLTSLWNNEAFRKKRGDDLDSLTNRYSRRFTVGVVGIALASAVFWMFVDANVAMKAFTSVLIVACPCALALAAPLTLGTAHRWLAGRNVFLRNAQVIERMALVNAIVLDKTGTLTTAAGVAAFSGVELNVSEVASVAALTQHSTHPHARRIAAALTEDAIRARAVAEFREEAGLGVAGTVNGARWLLGSRDWLESHGVRVPETESPEGSASLLAVNGSYRGAFAMNNALRPEVGALIRRLRGRYQLVLLSGDNAREAERFRALLGEEARVEFNQSPFDKLDVIRELQSSGATVMMVGDGLNDAGALQQADVGVAVVEEVGTFSPASDVILDAAQLPRLAEILSFSGRAARVVRIGFVVSGLYNVIGVSIAAAGLLSPLVCAVLMPLSSVTVVLFAIGTTRWMARLAFANGSSRRKEALPSSERDEVSLLKPASAAEASLP